MVRKPCNACENMWADKKGKDFHNDLVMMKGFGIDSFIGNILVDHVLHCLLAQFKHTLHIQHMQQ